MEAELREHLLDLAQRYAEAKTVELVTVARLAAGDWRFFERIQSGASFTARKYDDIVSWFGANWPSDAAWPEAVPNRSSTTEEGAAA